MSTVILAKLEAHPLFSRAQVVALYYPLPDEVDTAGFVERWSQKKKILLPSVTSNFEITLRMYKPGGLVKGAFGIEEPTGIPVTDYDSIDLIVVPGVAFDKKGNRLGRGKGMYDKLLKNIKAPKLGICFPYQLLNEVPGEPHDIPMDEVITIE